MSSRRHRRFVDVLRVLDNGVHLLTNLGRGYTTAENVFSGDRSAVESTVCISPLHDSSTFETDACEEAARLGVRE